ncbi:hypothetical protein P0O24_07130 [Methanotrichaceae archaeon M04Ac]|jgi:hypothetical protein|uniref:Uncharacterized protein n=1 Tax=Candidatus Methanocrinis alkalitolerans TaxID=3033395 RepID=A0ABT5XFS2_9EURY|nr:hypothetical protein [Candidatus Methanocrinis alkalitolerans]MDF0593352.1 hypothetical protein [Candidatus Methanocrinis alkalitolerans]
MDNPYKREGLEYKGETLVVWRCEELQAKDRKIVCINISEMTGGTKVAELEDEPEGGSPVHEL